ncbi:PIN domain-containing protein [Lachnospiraceae bacterium MD335]|nr:PIN domain-containing protein [Lachnospiraceae bacterium MD335]
MKLLVDTNIIIDALTGREPFREAAEQIMLLAANQIEDMYITAGSATDIYYLVRKHLHNTEQAKNAMTKLYQLFGILDVTADDCQNALLSDIKDYEDAVISCCAKRSKMDYIVTRNIKDYEKSKVKAVLPNDFIRFVSQSDV